MAEIIGREASGFLAFASSSSLLPSLQPQRSHFERALMSDLLLGAADEQHDQRCAARVIRPVARAVKASPKTASEL